MLRRNTRNHRSYSHLKNKNDRSEKINSQNQIVNTLTSRRNGDDYFFPLILYATTTTTTKRVWRRCRRPLNKKRSRRKKS